MFPRIKKAAPYEYLQVVENRWRDGKSHQRVLWTIGRVDRLKKKGTIDKLLRSLAKYSERALLLLAGVSDPRAEVIKIGPGLIFERLGERSGIKEVIKELLEGYKFEFDVERAIFLTVLHRLFAPGSDRRVERVGEGNPILCELWPDNTTDVKTLLPVVDRLKKRFHLTQVCVVSDRGMISKKTIEELEKPLRGISYILGVRMHKQKEVSQEVLARAGDYRVVHPSRELAASDPSPPKVKEVQVEKHRYILCYHPKQARKDALRPKSNCPIS